MYAVLIIDDEEPAREAIRILGDWEQIGVSLVMEASNGREGLSLVQANKPDLILIDMKMPVMDGPEFLQQVYEAYPDIYYVVVSGYDDFVYAREAIKAGAFDYLLKPVNRQELNRVLTQAFAEIRARKEKEEERIDRNITLNMSLPRLKERFFLSLIENSSNESVRSQLPSIGINEADQRFAVGVIRMMNLSCVAKQKFAHDTELLYFSLSNVLNEVLSAREVDCFSFNNPKLAREFIFIVSFAASDAELTMFSLNSMVGKAINQLESLYGMTTIAGLHKQVLEASQLSDGYEIARRILQGVNLLDLHVSTYSTPVISSEVGQASSNHLLTSRMTHLRQALEEGKMQNAQTIIDEYIERVKQSGYFSLGDAEQVLHEFIVLLNLVAVDLGVPQEKLSQGAESFLLSQGIVFDYSSFTEFSELLEHILASYWELLRTTMSSHFDVEDIKSYIDKYYYEQLSVSFFTEKYYLSREYLMRLFKQRYGLGIYEYVQKVRMEKAKQLLANPQLKIQDISSMVGFKDTNYFSKAFRNYFRLSPSQYKEQLTKNIDGTK